MLESNAIVFSTFLAQAAGSVLLSIVLLSFYRYYRRSYLLHWTWSWWALTIYLVTESAFVYISKSFEATHPLRIGLSLISQLTAYWQVAWLLFGAYEVTSQKEVPKKVVRQVLILKRSSGPSPRFCFSNDPNLSPCDFVRVGIRSFVTGTAFLIAAFGVWRRPGSGRLGPGIVSAAFLVHSLQQLQAFLSILFGRFTPSVTDFGIYLEFLDLVVLFVTGLGMVIWFLEVERSEC